jgi:hypothetical protein
VTDVVTPACKLVTLGSAKIQTDTSSLLTILLDSFDEVLGLARPAQRDDWFRYVEFGSAVEERAHNS